MPIWLDALLLATAAIAIGFAGQRLARAADRLADRTGLGEALTGTVILGAVTALPGLAASVTAALAGRPVLAIANALGGIAIQTVFLAIADLFHLRANLEHAAASLANLFQTALLILLLTLVLLGLSSPPAEVLPVHPASLLLGVAAVTGLLLVARVRQQPMWRPEPTAETVRDEPDPDAERARLAPMLSGVLVNGAVVTLAGVLVARLSADIVDKTRIPETLVGGLLTAVATSAPELVTTVAAVRRGALTLAVSDIVGGNFFDVLFLAAADLVYLRGSLYHAPGVGPRESFLAGLAVLLNVVLLLGLLYRQRRGPANIGLESVLMIALYLSGFLILGFFL